MGLKLSIGELIDRMSILNVKIWHAEEAFSRAKIANDNENMAKIAIMTRALNRERSDIREEINVIIEGRNTGSNKINYLNLGREQNGQIKTGKKNSRT